MAKTMRNFTEHRKWIGRLYSKTVIAILFVLVVFLGHAVWNVYQDYGEAREKEQLAIARLSDLRSREEDLEKDLEYLNTGHGFETEIRKRFDVARENEEVLVIIDSKEEAPEEEDKMDSKGWWETVKEFFTTRAK